MGSCHRRSIDRRWEDGRGALSTPSMDVGRAIIAIGWSRVFATAVAATVENAPAVRNLMAIVGGSFWPRAPASWSTARRFSAATLRTRWEVIARTWLMSVWWGRRAARQCQTARRMRSGRAGTLRDPSLPDGVASTSRQADCHSAPSASGLTAGGGSRGPGWAVSGRADADPRTSDVTRAWRRDPRYDGPRRPRPRYRPTAQTTTCRASPSWSPMRVVAEGREKGEIARTAEQHNSINPLSEHARRLRKPHLDRDVRARMRATPSLNVTELRHVLNSVKSRRPAAVWRGRQSTALNPRA
jgi:hypothetical protein